MRILAFDTATVATAVALCDDERVVEVRDDPLAGQRPHHATRLLPLIAQLMGDASVGWEEIDRIAVGLGPGTFTGLRIGVATAKALAKSSGVPVVGVSTLHALALNAGHISAEGEHDVVAAVLDARRSEVYAAAWEQARAHAEPLLSPRALPPSELVDTLRGLGSKPVAIGDGAIAFRETLERGAITVPGNDDVVHRVRATGHCQLARRLPVADPDALAPDYQRLPDAKPRSDLPGPPHDR